MLRTVCPITSLCIVVVSLNAHAGDTIKDLEPLIGEWHSSSGVLEFESSFNWILGENYIEHSQSVQFLQQTHEVREIIGWDPQQEVLKSWIFLPDAVATGIWIRSGEEWLIEVTLVRADGTAKHESKTLRFDGDSFVWTNHDATTDARRELQFSRASRDDSDH